VWSGQSLRVLPFVELAVAAGALDRLPPLAIVPVPRDRVADAVLPRPDGLPPEGAELRGVERVPAIVSGAIGDVADE
jgi:hypothetical protein